MLSLVLHLIGAALYTTSACSISKLLCFSSDFTKSDISHKNFKLSHEAIVLNEQINDLIVLITHHKCPRLDLPYKPPELLLTKIRLEDTSSVIDLLVVFSDRLFLFKT